MADELDNLAVGVAADHAEKKRRARKGAAEVADTVAAGAIEGAGAALDAGGDARDVAAATIGGAAAATAEVQDEAGADRSELRDAVDSLGDAVEARDEDDDRATDFMVDRLTAIAESAELDRGTLVGDVRDTLLDLFKANPKPWSQLLEDQQRRIADALETCAKALIRSVVVIVAEDSEEGGTIHAKLESYAEKGGLKIALTANGDRDTVLALHDAVGQQVVVKRADSNRYGGQRRDAPTDPDQPGLEFEADRDQGGAHPFAAPEGDDDLVAAADDLDADQDPDA